MNFLQFAVWGSYLTSMGGYLFAKGEGDLIGWFYAMQGIVSMFMPAIMGIIADKWIPAQRLLGLSNFIEEISSLSHSVVFLYFFALIAEEGFLISSNYSLELCIQMLDRKSVV